MENNQTLLIVLLILVGVLLLALICFIIWFVKKSKNQPVVGTRQDFESAGEIKAKIDGLDKSLEKTIELNMRNEMNKFSESMNSKLMKNSEDNNAKLERFQSNIDTQITKKFNDLNKQIEDKMAGINKKVDDRLQEGFKSTSETFSQVRERLQAIDEAQKNIEGLGKEVVSLKNVLEGNQSRGQYGEYQLEMVLHNVFGDTIGCYELQYTMKKVKDGDDVRADAVVFMPEPNKMYCIDSKFPFSKYSKIFETENEEEKEKLKKEFAADVKKHITAIKDKYIVEGKTAKEALMFIPNDGVFAYIHHDLQDVVAYAREKKVILTSPSTLPAILVTLNMVKIEVKRAEQAQEISKQLEKLGKDFSKFGEEWTEFSNAVSRISTKREALDKRVGKITGKFDTLKGAELLEEKNVEGVDILADDEIL